ncbi:Ribosome biogenesis protein bms1 [Lasiodiplodia theobromae]|uniref:Ribosome biogenesis protein bms1 n=1 Tax=Lasiodiplodia theobromae TaxID=45133 RepID=UPI0015C2F379|nr:Ribosome biogenesis protein bms1 [Lasiodiplodia theobromae]KAF4538006.1 Ribosome biogenesis protein bms1 [Lasiodiplodia theobromae]
MSEQTNKPHRAGKEKKKPTGGTNPKAFAFANPGKLQKQAARSHDVKEKRLHVPMVDRLPEEAPPIIVAVVGPPGVGKSTLIKSLIRRYTKQTLSHPTGPLTVVTSKRRRLTFIETPADSLAAMIDIAKVVDIVLLMIDGNYGFEMETMEFLNVLSATGMPGNVFGILTHLDLFKKQSALSIQKKRLKHRFWSELYQGAKLFYLSGVVNGRYPDREVLNLSRFLSVMKNPRPLVWRNSHPYCLADRFLDITPPTDMEEDPKCDRTVALYGYLRGTNFPAQGARVHVPGVGDLNVSMIEPLPDPCPTPFQEKAAEKATGKSKSRRLGEKQKVLFAPMSDVGGVLVDKDAVYIDVKKPTFNKDQEDEERGLGEQLVVGLQGERRLLGEADKGLKLFSNGEAISKNAAEDDSNDKGRTSQRHARLASKVEEEDEYGSEDEDDEDEEMLESGEEDEEDDTGYLEESRLGRAFRNEDDKAANGNGEDDIAFADSDSDLGSISSVEDQELEDPDDLSDEDEEEEDSSDDEGALKWKDNLAENARKAHGRKRPYRTTELARLMYNDTMSPTEVLKTWRGEQQDEDAEEQDPDEFFKAVKNNSAADSEDRAIPEYDYKALEEKWTDEDNLEALRRRFASTRLGKDGDEDEGSDDEFEGIEDDDEGDGAFEDLETGEVVGGKDSEEDEEAKMQEERDKNARKKEELRLRFEEEDRAGFANDKTNERAEGGEDEEFGEDDWYDAQKAAIQKQLDINRAEFEQLDNQSRNVPYEFSANFNPRFPIIIGGLTPTEDRFGYLQVRIKRHRWHKKILKTNDPLIFSLGWRRFQSLPVYSISDSRVRNRMLKYTPEHMHCFVLNVDESFEIVKKLKLTGHPYKIFKNTAFIKDMFGSTLEIAKFEGASIKTVSGIRGQIKRALSKPEGCFRATFEDKVLMSDIVFLRAWYPVKPHKFYNAVTNLLDLPGAEDEGIETPKEKNSAYRKIERAERHFNPLRVPKKLAADLPFSSQPVRMQKQKKETYMQKRAVVAGKEERVARNLMQQVMTLRNEKVAKRREAQEKRKEGYRRKVAENQEKRAEREKREKAEFWQKEGRKRKAQEAAANRGGKRRNTRYDCILEFSSLLPGFLTALRGKTARSHPGLVLPSLVNTRQAGQLGSATTPQAPSIVSSAIDRSCAKTSQDRVSGASSYCARPPPTAMETLASVAPDAAISPIASPDIHTAPDRRARAHPAVHTSHRDADRKPINATITTADVNVLPASQESNVSASSSASYAPALLSSQSNVSTESVVDTELTSPATSNVSSQCQPFNQAAPAPANQEDVRPPPRAVTPQPAPNMSEKPQNTSSASPMTVDTPTISQGTKRTASGAVKLPSSSAGLTATGLCTSENPVSTNALASLSRIGKLSADLKTRLSYAMIKVQNGWEQKSIDELETATTSQRTSRSATQTPTSAKFRNATDSPHAYDRRRRPSALSDPSDRYLGTPGAQRSPSKIRTFGPTDFGRVDPTDEDARPSTASTFSSSASSAPTLAPALDISPKRHRRSTSTRAPPMLGSQPKVQITKPFTDVGAPATPMPGKPQRPVGILRMPSQQAEMDAVDSLLFMSSPNNSAHLAHTSASATSTAHPSPLKTEFPAAKRVAFDDRSSSSNSSETEREMSSGRARVVQAASSEARERVVALGGQA